tara:strand:- start:776 stop:1378 length:603 start_codon:yes stop_codon:yes gene_type:complete
MSKKQNSSNTTEKVRFQDCARVGVELPKAERLKEGTYATQLQQAEKDDKVRASYEAGDLDEDMQKLLNNEQVFSESSYLPNDLTTENGTIVSFDSNVERFNALNTQKSERSGHYKNLCKWYPELKEEADALINKCNKIARADKQNFFKQWVEKVTDENGNQYESHREGYVEFSIIGKRATDWKEISNTLISSKTKGGDKE